MMTRLNPIKLFFTGISLTLIFSISHAQESPFSPEVQYAQDKLIEARSSTGYGDAEIDDLHRRIGEILPKLNNIITNNGQERKVRLAITSGQSYRLTGEQYIITGYADVYIRPDNTLEKVVLIYERLNAIGNTYLAEKRELLNPTPNYHTNGQIDANDDLILVYSESKGPNEKFKQLAEIKFDNIDRHRNRTQILRAYKQYLRKTITALDTILRNRETSKRAQIKYMLEFE